MIETVSFDTCYERAVGLHAVEVDGETVVYVEATESLHLLDNTATIVFQALDSAVTLTALCDELAQAFAADVQRICVDVETLMRHLIEIRLVKTPSP